MRGPEDKRGDFWRTWVVRLTAFVFILQSVGLFAAPARAGRLPEAAAVAEMAMPDCPHHKSHGKGHGQGSPDSCPMCQALGFALAGAPLPRFVEGFDRRLIGPLAAPGPRLPPRPPTLQSPPPRGPPALV